jgi:hypothetical protein
LYGTIIKSEQASVVSMLCRIAYQLRLTNNQFLEDDISKLAWGRKRVREYAMKPASAKRTTALPSMKIAEKQMQDCANVGFLSFVVNNMLKLTINTS